LSATEAAETLLDLDDEQHAAVRAAPGPLLILAGPGAGKTRTLTHRLAHLVATQAVTAREVLCITFTNRAAAELAERVAILLGPEAARAVTLGTFHAVCHRLVRAHPERLGRSAAFSIYDSADSRRLCAEATAKSQLGAEEVQRAIALAKGRLWTPERLAIRAVTARQRAIAETWTKVEASLAKADALDFDDLVAGAARLLEQHSDLRSRYAERWKAVLVDEFQDVSPAQYRWVALLCAEHRNLTVVADEDQAIYGFRGADARSLERLRRDFPELRTALLTHNYRSREPIVRAASAVVAHNRERVPRRLRSAVGPGPAVRAHALIDEFDEARTAAMWVSAVLERGVPPGEVAILYRTRALVRPLERTLIEAGLPHRVLGGRGFFETAEVRDALACLRVVVNPRDRMAFARAAATQPGVGPATAARVLEAAGRHGISPLEAAARAAALTSMRPAQAEAAAAFGRRFVRLATEAPRRPLAAVCGEVILAAGLPKRVSATGGSEAGERLERLRDLVRQARAYASSEERPTLAGFLAHAALLSQDGANEEERVTLATVHSAKGLEWRAVRVVGLEEGTFPHERALREGSLEEERRLCYVALTRAGERLALSRADYRYGRRVEGSRFLGEAGVAGEGRRA